MIPTESVITAEMRETGLDRMQAIRRIQQRDVLRRRMRNGRYLQGAR